MKGVGALTCDEDVVVVVECGLETVLTVVVVTGRESRRVRYCCVGV